MLFYLLFVFLLISKSSARIENINISDSKEIHRHIASFGFYKDGILSINITNFNIGTWRNDQTFGFVLQQNNYFDLMSHIFEATCPLSDIIQSNWAIVYIKFNFQTKIVDVKNLESREKSFTVPLTYTGNEKEDIFNAYVVLDTNKYLREGFYDLYFHSCVDTSSTNITYSLQLDVAVKNWNNYLSSEEMPLPMFYSIISILYFVLLIIWSIFLWHSKKSICTIHFFMTLTIIFKLASLLVTTADYTYIERYGNSLQNWTIVMNTIISIKNILFYTTLFLIAIGWTIIKNFLTIRQKLLLIVVILMQINVGIGNFLNIKKNVFVWNLFNSIANFVSTIIILIVLLSNINHLQKSSKLEGKGILHLKKASIYKQFSIVTALYFYIYYPFFIAVSLLPFQYYFMIIFAKELLSICFYVYTGCRFKPVQNNIYYLLAMEDSDEEDLILSKTPISETLSKITLHSPTYTTNLVEVTTNEKNTFFNAKDSDFTL